MPNWADVLQQIQARRNQGALAVDLVRRLYLRRVQKRTGRNIIAYYSGFLSKPDIFQTEINDEDKNGLMMAVHKLDRARGLDLFIHTPGGSLAATESITDYLHRMFGRDVRAIVPQIAMSAGTILACACKSIVMAKHSNLGPIDPHVRGVPAYGVIEEFRRASEEVKKDPSRILIWQPIIGQYRPTFLSQCENAINWGRDFVADELIAGMFAGDRDAEEKARKVVEKLTDYTGNKSHDRHIHIDECIQIGLTVERLEDDPVLQDLVLTVHHCFMHTLMNTAAFKIIENHLGTAFIKIQAVQTILQPSG